MDVCEDFQDISDEMSSAEKRNIEDKDSAMSVAFEAGEPSSSITSIQVDETYECEDSETDLYLLDVSATIAEMEGEEIEEEFDDALVEIAGVKSFPCEQCDKVCRSKGGLTRHFNSKHGQVPAEQSLILKSFSFETVSSIVESIKTKVTKEKLYGPEMCNAMEKANATKALFDALYPLFATFCKKKNQDKLVESFFALIKRSCELLNCKDYKASNLIMIHIPDHLVGFYHTSSKKHAGETEASQIKKLDPAERGPLAYVAGYVVSKLFQKSKRKSENQNQSLQSLLQSMKSIDQSTNFISARSRGGLVNPSTDLLGILEKAEYLFRKQVGDSTQGTLRKICTDTICNNTLQSPVLQSLWDNIVMSAGVDHSSSTQKLCLENVIKLYLRVRSFSYARDYLTKHKIKEKLLKKKALRKDLKQSSVI